MSTISKPTIGITLGDVAGIGPEVVVRSLLSRKLNSNFRYAVIGDKSVLRRVARDIKVVPDVQIIEPKSGGMDVSNIAPGKADMHAHKAAISWIDHGVELCQQGALKGLVTAPVNKEGLKAAGFKLPGQTEYLAKLTNTKKFAMMLVGGPLRVALVTTHIPLARVSETISMRKVEEVIQLTDQVLRQMKIAEPRIAVAGLNPHAGENGLFGNEEAEKILPAVESARKSGIHVAGPVSPDAVFHQAYEGSYDAIVCMYHDQGLIPLKMIAFSTGVNLTLGLPFPRTSPDHGTAYDIAGRYQADPLSMIHAINLAAQLCS